jgi:hypothetical protein
MISALKLPHQWALYGIFAFVCTFPACAAEPMKSDALPDPAKIVAPDISTNDPKALSDGYKFFIFHSSSVNFSTAYTDILECRRFMTSSMGFGRKMPDFIPWVVTPQPRALASGPNQYGLVGSAIEAISAPKILRGLNNTILRRCMETRGYARYPVSEVVWESLNDPENPTAIAVQAKIASGPKPLQAEVVDQ